MAVETSLTNVAPIVSEFRCADCGYGVSRNPAPERCPMCGRSRWLPEARRPISAWEDGPLGRDPAA
jgi:rubrerythrin